MNYDSPEEPPTTESGSGPPLPQWTTDTSSAMACTEHYGKCHPLRVPGLQRASQRPTPEVPRDDCLDKRVRVELHPRPGKRLVPTEGRHSIDPRLWRHVERVAADARPRSDADYCLERRHPAARASFSVQNHRSPFDVLIRVPDAAEARDDTRSPPLSWMLLIARRKDHPNE